MPRRSLPDQPRQHLQRPTRPHRDHRHRRSRLHQRASHPPTHPQPRNHLPTPLQPTRQTYHHREGSPATPVRDAPRQDIAPSATSAPSFGKGVGVGSTRRVGGMKAAAVSVPTAGHVTTGVAIAIGLGAGLLAGLFGVGGGLIIVPGLLIFGRMDRRLAHGTSLGSTLIIAIASLLTYLAHGNVDWAIAALLAAGSVAGAVIGTHLLQIVPRAVLVYLF